MPPECGWTTLRLMKEKRRCRRIPKSGLLSVKTARCLCLSTKSSCGHSSSLQGGPQPPAYKHPHTSTVSNQRTPTFPRLGSIFNVMSCGSGCFRPSDQVPYRTIPLRPLSVRVLPSGRSAPCQEHSFGFFCLFVFLV